LPEAFDTKVAAHRLMVVGNLAVAEGVEGEYYRLMQAFEVFVLSYLKVSRILHKT
jgi:hypothetical protein